MTERSTQRTIFEDASTDRLALSDRLSPVIPGIVAVILIHFNNEHVPKFESEPCHPDSAGLYSLFPSPQESHKALQFASFFFFFPFRISIRYLDFLNQRICRLTLIIALDSA